MTSKQSLFTFRVPDSSPTWQSRNRKPVSLDQKEKTARDFRAYNLHVGCTLQSVHEELRDKCMGSDSLNFPCKAEISPIDRKLVQANYGTYPSARIRMFVA